MGQQSVIRDLDIVFDSLEYTVATITLTSEDSFFLAWAHKEFSSVETHEVQLSSGTLRWTGPQLVEKRGR